MTKRFFFGTNFKMYQTHAETQRFLTELIASTQARDDLQLFLIPPFTSLAGLPEIAATAGIWIGAQNMHFADEGEYTGAIAAPMLKALNLDLVMLGHAERRKHFGETDQALNKKLHTALGQDLQVLLCVGESAEDRHYGIEREIIATQLKICLHDVSPDELSSLLIAYEPVWSIGQGGQPAIPDQVEPIVQQMRTTLDDLFGEAAQAVPILYGGSINLHNCQDYAQMPSLDGLFVGRAARQVEGFVSVLNAALQAWKNSV